MARRSPLVLLAEDNSDLRQLIANRLINEGMGVVEVEDGTELFDYLIQCQPGGVAVGPDVVVSDIDMPGETGPSAMMRSRVSLPVILITAQPTPAVREAALKAGVIAILEKPFALQSLILKIREICPSSETFGSTGIDARPSES